MGSELREILRHVALGRRIVADQKDLITRLHTAGRSTFAAETLLRTFESTLAIFEAELDAMRAEHLPSA